MCHRSPDDEDDDYDDDDDDGRDATNLVMIPATAMTVNYNDGNWQLLLLFG